MGYKIEQSGSLTKLSGHIDETCDLAASLNLFGTLHIDVSRVTGMNSIGTLKLIRLIEPRAGFDIYFYGCTSIFSFFISYVALKFGAQRASRIFKSFYLVYNCPSCNEEKQILLETQQLGTVPAQYSLPQSPCPDCGKIMQTTEEAEDLIEMLSKGA
jgi:ssDNA-binding Zn-finger/Zn-ribbon topoisomerase 1